MTVSTRRTEVLWRMALARALLTPDGQRFFERLDARAEALGPDLRAKVACDPFNRKVTL